MTRLIDADALMKCIPSEENASIFAVANAPTVETIPIEWIRKYMKKYDNPYCVDYVIFEEMIEEWEHETDKR